MSLLSLVLAFALPTGVVEAVRIDQVGLRPAVTVVTRGGSGAVGVRREGRDVILSVGASLPGGLRLPGAVPPLEALTATQDAQGTALRLTVPEDVPYQILRTETTISVVLGPLEPTSNVPLGEKRPAQELYPLIFAVPSGGDTTPGEQQPVTPTTEGTDRRDDDQEGFYIGFVRLRPSILFNYVDAESSLLDTPQPVQQNYFEIYPRLGVGVGMGTEFSLFGSRLEIRYEPKFRTGVQALRRPTHVAFARLTVPVGSAVTLRGSHHHSRGFLETTEVDAGREYFFDLGDYVRNVTEAGARIETGSPFDLDAAVDRERVDIEETAGFFDFQRDRLALTPGYLVRPDLKATLGLVAERIPPPARHPQAEAQIRRLTFGLDGEMLPLVRGSAHASWEDYRTPRAAAGGTRRRGFVGALALEKEFTPSASLTLSGQRKTQPSAFEENGFYLTNRIEASQTLPLPFFIALRGAVAKQWNRYPTLASGLGEPRRDDIFGWSVGLGRSFTRWAYLRADYRRERRRSNLDAFNVDTHALVLQVGIGYLGTPQP